MTSGVGAVGLSGERRTTRSPRVRTVAGVMNTSDTVGGAFADVAETIEAPDLVCSGFRAERTTD